MTGGRRTRALFALTMLSALVLYGTWAALFVRAGVGYEMDEAIYVESAVFLLRGSGTPPFVHEPAAWLDVRNRRLPLMIIPYVGAVKGYVSLPLFAAFGISTGVARLSGILLGALGIAGLAALIAAEAGAVPAVWTALALAIHPSYLDMTVFDNGGASVWMGVMGLLALALRRHLRLRTPGSALLLGIAAGVAVWARANLVWLLLAAGVAALAVFGRRAHPPRRHVLAFALGGLLGASPLLWYEWASFLATFRFIANTRQPLTLELLARRLRWLADLAISDREQRIVWGGPPVGPLALALGAALLLLAAAAIFPAPDPADPGPGRWRRAFAATAAAVTALLLSSRLNVTQHHLVAVLPLAFAALAIGAWELARRVAWTRAVLAAAAAGLAAIWLSCDLTILRGLRESGGRGAFSSAIDDVSRYLRENPVTHDRLKVLNWGIQNNLYVVSGGAVHGTELFWGANRKRSQRGLLWEDEIKDGGSFLLFAFPMGPPWISDGAAGFRQALELYAGPKTVRSFSEHTGTPYAVLIEIPPTR